MKMAHDSVSISTFLLMLLIAGVFAPPPNIAYPDSYEMYSYKSPRNMNDLKQQHMRQAMSDVSSTINEVQRILEKDPNLPRLTRGEIEDLFEMVTRQEYRRSLEAGDFERAKHMRSLMLVLPFNANSNSEERLEALFTRTPSTKLINNDAKRPKPQRIVLPASAENSIFDQTGAHTVNQLATTYKPNYVTAPVTTFHPKGTVQTVGNPMNMRTTQDISTYHPKTSTRRLTTAQTLAGNSFKSTDKLSSRYDAQTTTFLPTKVPTIRPNVKNLLATIGLEPDDSQSKTVPAKSSTTNFVTTVPTTTTTPSVTTSAREITKTTSTTTTTTTTTTEQPELTPELKELLESFGLLTNEQAPAHITAGPYQEEFLPVFPSALKDDTLSVSEFRPLPKSVTVSDIKGKIDNSFEIKPDDFQSFKRLPLSDEQPSGPSDEEFESILKSYGLIETDDSRDEQAEDKQPEKTKLDVSTTIEPALIKVTKMMRVPEVDVQFLSPQLSKVLGDMGIKNTNERIDTEDLQEPAESAEPTTSSTATATSTAQVQSSTMGNDLLKLHHLLDTIKQLEKLNANLTEEDLKSLDPKNFNFSSDLSDQGPDPLEAFYNSDDTRKNEVKRQLNSSEPTKISLDLSGTTSKSPSSTPFDNFDDEDDRKIETTSNKKTDDDSDAAAAADGGNGDGNGDDNADDTATVETTTSARAGKSEDSVSSTTEPQNGSLSDLADSFGGRDGLDPVSEEPLPPPRKNGFYFFSDWNSFLEVGEDPDKVVVRFDPKVGDPTQFIPVKIP